MIITTNKKKVFPGFYISLGGTLLFTCLILLLPLSALFLELSKITFIQYWHIITSSQVIAAYKITIFSAIIAAIFNAIVGMLIAWVLTRYNFPGRNFIDAIIDLPFALPTAVAGLTLSKLFSIHGWYGNWLLGFNIKISYTWLGISIAMAFTSLPFVIRTVQPILEKIDTKYEEAAEILGANKLKIFFYIIFPETFPSLLIGTLLSFIRSLGEFGAVILISSNIPWKTEVVSLIIFTKLQEFNYPAASAISSVILFISLFLLCIVNNIQNSYRNRLGES